MEIQPLRKRPHIYHFMIVLTITDNLMELRIKCL